MNDIKPFKHGSEGTHYACPEVLMDDSMITCCGCSGHKCEETQKTNDWEDELRQELETCNHLHGEECGNNYYGKEGFQCRCGRDECINEHIAFIQKQIAEAEKRGADKLFEAIDKEFKSFKVSAEIGRILIDIKKGLDDGKNN